MPPSELSTPPTCGSSAEAATDGGTIDQTDVFIGLPPGWPPLMVTCDRFLSRDDCARIRKQVQEAFAKRQMPIFEPGLSLLQLIHGQWVPIERASPPGGGQNGHG